MRIGSLFSGIGGLELGIERAGVGHTVWQVEIDPFCREVLAQHWPAAERFEDVTRFEGRPADLICGGFPCQDISSAGKRAGIDGERSALWREFARIIGLVLPRFVVVENVAALLTRGMGAVLGDLATLGYDAIWDCVPAQAVGAPHRRDRIFVVAWRIPNAERDGIRDESKRGTGFSLSPNGGNPWSIALGAAMDDTPGPRRKPGQPVTGRQVRNQAWGEKSERRGFSAELADPGSVRRGSGRTIERDPGQPDYPKRGNWPPSPDDLQAWGRVPSDSQPSFCRMADGLPEALDRDRRKRLRALGNAVVPPVAEIIGRVILELFSA